MISTTTFFVALFFSSGVISPQTLTVERLVKDVSETHSAYLISDSTGIDASYIDAVNPILMHYVNSELAKATHYKGMEQAIYLYRGQIALITTKFNVLPIWISTWEEIGYSTHSIGSLSRPLSSPDTYAIDKSSYAVVNYARSKTAFNRSLKYALFKCTKYAATQRHNYLYKAEAP